MTAPESFPSCDPTRLTPEARRRRIAELLATGLVRLGTALVPPPDTDNNVSESTPNQLALSGDKSVTVSAG